MYPIHKEKYYLTGDTFHTFMRDRLKADLDKEKNGYKLMTIAMFIAAAVVLFLVYLGPNPELKNDFVWMVIPFLLIVLGMTNIRKQKQADIGLNKKIINDYTNQKFEKEQITVKFYEDKFTYEKGSNTEEYYYNTFKKFYEAEKYFAIYLQTGDIVIFNGNCKKDKIKEIITGYINNSKE